MGENIINPVVTVGGDVLLHLMMRAARFDVGGKTGLSGETADLIMRIAEVHRDSLDEESLAKFAADIRECVSTSLYRHRNVKVSNEWNHVNRYDAYSRIAEVLENHPNFRFNELDFEVDCESGDVTVTRREKPLYGLVWLHDSYIEPWIKLANVLDKDKWWRVTVEYDGKTETLTCISWPQGLQEYDEKRHETADFTYRTVYIPVGRAHGASWIADNCIRSVEPYTEEER